MGICDDMILEGGNDAAYNEDSWIGKIIDSNVTEGCGEHFDNKVYDFYACLIGLVYAFLYNLEIV